MRKSIQTVLWVALGIAFLWVTVAFCLPVLLPFGIGALVARLAAPLVERLHTHLHLPRWLCVFVCVSVLLGLLGLLLWLLVRSVVTQMGSLVDLLPSILKSASQPIISLENRLMQLSERAPASVAPTLRRWIQEALRNSSSFGQRVSDSVFSFLGSLVTGLPELLLFIVAAVLSAFMLCARLPQIRLWLENKLPNQIARLRVQLLSVLGGWFKAQAKLTGITFGIVTVGLWILHQPYAILLGCLIALVDALPVFGSGTVLLPWGAICLLQGQTQKGIGLALLYALTALTRTVLEPRMLGKQLGLSPLLTLLAIYAGYRLCGVGGMLLFPLGAMALRQVYEAVEDVLPAFGAKDRNPRQNEQKNFYKKG